MLIFTHECPYRIKHHGDNYEFLKKRRDEGPHPLSPEAMQLGTFKEDFAVVGPRDVDVPMSSHIPRLLEEGSILLRQLFVHIYLCPLQFTHDVLLHCIFRTRHFTIIGFARSSLQAGS